MFRVKIIEGLDTSDSNAISDMENKLKWWMFDNARKCSYIKVDVKFMPVTFLNGETRYEIVGIIQYDSDCEL